MNNAVQTYAVKCHECKVTVRMTIDIRESYAGTRCETCRAIR